jgi:hypothetical protein
MTIYLFIFTPLLRNEGSIHRCTGRRSRANNRSFTPFRMTKRGKSKSKIKNFQIRIPKSQIRNLTSFRPIHHFVHRGQAEFEFGSYLALTEALGMELGNLLGLAVAQLLGIAEQVVELVAVTLEYEL